MSFEFNSRLAEIMKDRNISQYKLRQLSGVSQSMISDILTNAKSPSFDTIQRLLNGLGITLQEFFDGVIPTGEDKAITAIAITEKTGASDIQQNGRAPRSHDTVTTEPIDPSIERMNDPVMDGIMDNLQLMSPEERETFWRLSQSVVNRTTKGIS